MKIFLSYGHDRNSPIVSRIKRDLEAAGHVVWIDSSEIKEGDDWRRSIVDGLSETDWTLGFLSQHSVRNPGVCLDELGIALHVKGGTIATVLVEAEAAAQPPVSISHIQWLDMHDWAVQLADNNEAGEKWYRSKLEKILAVLADPANERFAGEIEELDKRLRPIPQDADIGALVDGFIGRTWLKSKLEDWRKNARDSRLLWISGAPGTGKSAFAAWLAHLGGVNVIALNLCRYNVDERRDPARVLRTIAFQVATRLPDYRRLLLDRLQKQDPDGSELDRKSPAALFDSLLAEPLRLGIDGGRGRERYLVVIDALDETIRNGRSALTEVLAESCQKLPDWIAVVATSRPEPSILRQLAGFKPQTIAAESDENLADLRAYAGGWLASENPGPDELKAQVERMVAASEGNFLYLRMLREAVAAGRLDLAHPDGLPQGLVGLYERWFRRQFPDAGSFETCRPLLEILVAAEHAVPEAWLGRMLGGTKQSQARMLEGIGSLVERRPEGVALFHKSLRDWLADARSAGADFVIDAAPGTKRMVGPLLEAFESWTREPGDAALDPFCDIELLPQLTGPNCDPEQLRKLGRLLGEPDVIRRRMLIGTDADEDVRRRARHYYRDLADRLAKAWPEGLDAGPLWKFVEGLTACAWAAVTDEYGPRGIVIWEDVQPPVMASKMPEVTRRYKEWCEGILLLVTALDTAGEVAGARPQLAPGLSAIMDSRLREFIRTGADGLANEVFLSTAGREYLPQRNVSFLRGSAGAVYRTFRSDPRLADWAGAWAWLGQ